MKHFPFIKPSFPSPREISKDFSEIVDRNYYTNSGPVEKDLAKKISSFIGEGINTSLMNNATTALILSIKLLFDSTKKYVPIQSFTFVAGAQAIRWCGFEPIFIDIDPETWQPSKASLEEAFNMYGNNIAGVVLCNSFGTGNIQIKELIKICSMHKSKVVIDSAAGFGSKYSYNNNVGIEGDCEIFSMHATKPFAIGEAGAVTSKDSELIKKLDEMKNFGFNDSKQAEYPGLNGKLPEILASIGARQLQGLDDRLNNRRAIYGYYKELLQNKGYKFQVNSELSSLPFVSVLVPNKVNKNNIVSKLNKNNIDARSYYNPVLHIQPIFNDCKKIRELPNTLSVGDTILSLPLYDDMRHEDVDYICKYL